MEKLWWVARLDFTASFLALIVTSKIHRVPCFSAAVTTTTRMSTSQEWVKVSTLGWSRYKLWQSIWQSATLQTALKACFHFVTFAALDTLSLPSTWTETWASLAIEYCWGSWDLCFICLWGKPSISCFVRSSLKLCRPFVEEPLSGALCVQMGVSAQRAFPMGSSHYGGCV